MAVVFNPEVQSLQQFLHTWPPSTTANPRVAWIYVRNAAAASVKVKGDSEGLAAAWSSLCVSKDDAVASADLDALALEYNVLSGKWLIFSTSSSVDMDWSKVRFNDLSLHAHVLLVCRFFDNSRPK